MGFTTQIKNRSHDAMELIRPHYYKGECGNKPCDSELMLILQNLYNLSGDGCIAEVIDCRAFSDYCRVDSSNQIPKRRYARQISIACKSLQEMPFTLVVKIIINRELILKKRTIVDLTIIAAPSSTKNKDKSRDSETKSTNKGNT